METAALAHRANPSTEAASLWTTCDPRALGAMHLSVVLFGVLVSALYALVAQAVSGQQPSVALEMVRMHGVVAVYVTLLPALPAALGNLLLPSAVGVRDLALPRLGRAAFRLHALGLLLMVVAMARGAAGLTWTLHAMFRASEATDSVYWLMASLVVLALSNAAVAVNVLVTVHASRKPGAPWSELSPLGWGLHGASLVTLLVTPVIVAFAALLLAERVFGLGVFDPAAGGDPLRFGAAVWLYLHPALGASFVAAAGVVAHLLRGEKASTRDTRIGPALLGLALVGLLGWGQHLYAVLQSPLSVLEFGVAAVLPQVFYVWLLGWTLRTLRAGGLTFDVPTGYALAFLVHVAILAPTGLVLALPATGVAYGATTFATGHLHYLAVGAVLFALLGGLHRAWPSLTGRTYDSRRAGMALVLLIVGTNASFVAMLQQGASGATQPAVPAALGPLVWRILSVTGGVVTLTGLVLVVAVLAGSMLSPARAQAAT